MYACQPVQARLKVRCGDGGVGLHLHQPPGSRSQMASMLEVRAAAATAIRAMSRHVSQVDLKTHAADAFVTHGVMDEQVELPTALGTKCMSSSTKTP